MRIKAPSIKSCLYIFALIFVSQYVLEHAAYLITDAVYAGSIFMTAPTLAAVRATVSYLIEAVELVSMGAAAGFVIVALSSDGITSALSVFGIVALTKLLYVIPHYYMVTLSYGYDSLEALLLSAAISLGMLLLMAIELAAATALGALPAILLSRREARSFGEVLTEGLLKNEPTDLGNRGTAALFIAASVVSLKSIILAIVDTVAVIAERGSALSGGDIFGIIFSLLYPIALTALSYLTMHLIKQRLTVTDGDEHHDEDPNDVQM